MHEIPTGQQAVRRMMKDSRVQNPRAGLNGEVAFGGRINLGGIYLEARRAADGTLHLVLYDENAPDAAVDVMAQAEQAKSFTMQRSGAAADGGHQADAALLVPTGLDVSEMFVSVGTAPTADMTVQLVYAANPLAPSWESLADAVAVVVAGTTVASIEFSAFQIPAGSLISFSLASSAGAANIVVQAVGT